MADRLVLANHYRRRAEELRTMARDDISDEAILMLAKVADDYEKRAAQLERSASRDGVYHL